MKKELYWIHGSEENPDGVINALQDKGILIGGLWDNPFGRINKVIFGVPGHLASVTDRYDAFFAEVIKPAGIELKPFSEEKAAGEDEIDKLKPFDRVVARIAPAVMDDKKYQAMLANVGRHCYVFPNIEVNDDPDIIDDDDLVGYAWRFFHEGPRKGIVKNVGIAIDGGIGYDVDIQNYNGVETEFSVPPSFVAFNYEQYAYQCREMRGVINRVLKAVKELKSRFRLTEGIADDGWLTKENKDD